MPASLVAGVISGHSQTFRNWTGNASGFWSNPNNWDPVGVPQNEDFLSFFADSNRSMVNDLPDLIVSGLRFDFHDYTLAGNPLTVGRPDAPGLAARGLVEARGFEPLTVTINCSLILGNDTQFDAGETSDSTRLRLNADINLNGHTAEMEVSSGGRIEVAGSISGAGDVLLSRFSNVGTIEFMGTTDNTFAGTMIADHSDFMPTINFNKQAGSVVTGRLEMRNGIIVHVRRPHQIGDGAVVCVSDGSQLLLHGNTETIGSLCFTNNGADASPALVDTGGSTLSVFGRITAANFSGSVTPTIRGLLEIEMGSHTFDISGSSFYGLNLEAPISGQGGIRKSGNAALLLQSSNSFLGTVAVVQGIAEARHERSFGDNEELALNGNGSITLRNVIIQNKTLLVRGTESVTANTAGSLLTGLGLSGWRGRIELETNLVVNSTDLCSIGGPVVGPGGFEFIGSRHSLSGASVQPNPSTFTGLTRVLCEQLQVSEEHALRGPLVVGGGFGGQCEIRWAFPSLARGVPEVTVHPNGLVNLNGRNENFLRLIMNGGRVITGAGFLTVARIITNPTNVTATIEGNLGFSSFPTTEFTVADGSATPDLAISAIITDGTLNAVGIVKRGDGELRLSGANDYDGPTRIDEGVVHIQNNAALGTTAEGTTVADGATLQVESVAALPEPLNVRGAGRGGTLGVLNFLPATGTFGPIVLAGPTTMRVDSSFAIISSAISGTGPLTKVGAGTLQFGGGGGPANTYTGDTIVEEGILVLSKGTGVTTVPGHLIIGGGGGLFGASATVRHFAGFTILGGVTLNRGGLWDLNGFSESFSAAGLQGRPALTLNVGSDVQTGTGTVFLPVGGDVVVNPGTFPGASSAISGNLALEPGPHRFIVQSGVSGIGIGGLELDVSAVISQTSTAADIVKEGLGNMRLAGANSFTGPVTVNEGTLTAANAQALGTAAGGTFVNNNASLALDGGLEVEETLTLDSTNASALLSLGPVTNTWSGNVILQRTAGINVVDARGGLTHSGIAGFGAPAPNISGPGGFTKSGRGALFIAGLSRGNSYTGPTTITDGLLEAVRAGRSLSTNIVVTGPGSTLRTGRPGDQFNVVRTVLPVGANVTVQDGALWSMNATNIETVSRLGGDGRLEIGSGGALTVTNEVDCTFSGVLSGSGALNKRGPATLRLTADSFYSGAATVFEGTYKADGRMSNPVTVKSSATLRGGFGGGDATIESGGLVEPDPVFPGQIGGTLFMASANFQAGATLGATFFGPDPTGGNDHLEVANAVTLNNTRLNADFAYAPREGDIITLIIKSAAGPINGTFDGLPEGSLQSIDGIPVVMSYVGGNGNEATLTVTNLPLRSGGAQVVSGNGGGTLVPNDCSQLWLVVTNRGASAITGMRGKLRSLTEGLVVTVADSAFPNLAPDTRGSNATPFQIRTDPTFACGAGAQLELLLIGSNIPPMAIVYTFPGNAGTALAFNGSGNYVAIPHTTSLNPYPFTLTFWVKTLQSVGVAGLANKYPASLNGWNINLRGGRARAWYYRSSANFVSRGTAGMDGGYVADDQWHHVAFTVDASGGKIYRDGVLEDSAAWTGLAGQCTTTQGIRLGNDFDNGVALNGLMDEVTLWRTALSQAQIQTNMFRGLTGLEANLVAYYRCDEGSGITVFDSAPNIGGDNHGAWVGAPLFVFSSVGPFSLPGGGDCTSGRGACESCFVVSGRFTTNAPQSARFLSPGALRSACDPPKPCPGFLESTVSPLRYVMHHFTNHSAAELCVTAQMRIGCPNPLPSAFGVAAYVGTFLTNEPCSNYLGDDGAYGAVPPPFSFRVPPRTNFLIVVTAFTGEPVCDNYTLELFGLPCPPPRLDIAKDTMPDKVLMQWSSAYPDYRLQSANTLNAPSPTAFSNVTATPTLLGGKFIHTNSTAARREFFRLAK